MHSTDRVSGVAPARDLLGNGRVVGVTVNELFSGDGLLAGKYVVDFLPADETLPSAEMDLIPVEGLFGAFTVVCSTVRRWLRFSTRDFLPGELSEEDLLPGNRLVVGTVGRDPPVGLTVGRDADLLRFDMLLEDTTDLPGETVARESGADMLLSNGLAVSLRDLFPASRPLGIPRDFSGEELLAGDAADFLPVGLVTLVTAWDGLRDERLTSVSSVVVLSDRLLEAEKYIFPTEKVLGVFIMEPVTSK